MTAIRDWVDISAGHVVPQHVDQMDLLGLRETFGAYYPDPDFEQQYKVARKANPAIVTLGYVFLTGPKRADPKTAVEQVDYWADHHKCDLGALDWEGDSYKGQNFGIQPFTAVVAGVREAQKLGINAGVYGSRYLFTPSVVETLIVLGVPFLWIAAYGPNNGPAPASAIPQWIVKRCQKAEILLFHQFAGATLDRNRVLVGTLEQLHALAGGPAMPPPVEPPSEGDVMTNLVPLTAHRVVDLAAGTVLFKTPGGQKFTTLAAPIRLGLLGGAGPDYYHVADGDNGVYVKRTDATVATADINVGA